jgi:hypothetical protein
MMIEDDEISGNYIDSKLTLWHRLDGIDPVKEFEAKDLVQQKQNINNSCQLHESH